MPPFLHLIVAEHGERRSGTERRPAPPIFEHLPTECPRRSRRERQIDDAERHAGVDGRLLRHQLAGHAI